MQRQKRIETLQEIARVYDNSSASQLLLSSP